MTSFKENFASNLDRLLRQRKMNQRTFAKALGVAENTVSNWLNMDRLPREQYWDKIAEVLNVPYTALVRTPPENDDYESLGDEKDDPVLTFLRSQMSIREREIGISSNKKRG